MPRPPGMAKTGGRRRGTPNKHPSSVRARAMRQHDVSPVDFMLGIVANEALELPMRLDAARSVAPYTNPRLSAIDATVRSEVKVVLSPEQRRERARQAILEAFAERPLITDATYHVVGGNRVDAVTPPDGQANSEPPAERDG